MPDEDARTVVEGALREAAAVGWVASEDPDIDMDQARLNLIADTMVRMSPSPTLTRLLDLVEKGQALEWLEKNHAEVYCPTHDGQPWSIALGFHTRYSGTSLDKAINGARAAQGES